MTLTHVKICSDWLIREKQQSHEDQIGKNLRSLTTSAQGCKAVGHCQTLQEELHGTTPGERV